MLETEIKKLREAIEANTAALFGASTETPTAQEPVEKTQAKPKAKVTNPKTETVKDEVAEPDFGEIKEITLGLSRSGKKDEVRTKLDEFGAQRLSDLKGDDLAAFGEWARAQ